MAAYEWKLPDVGEGIHEAEIMQWLVAEGDEVAPDQPILQIQTDKAVVDIPSPTAGRVAKILAQEGELVRVGTVVIVFDSASGSSAAVAPEPEPAVSPSSPALPVSAEKQVAGRRALATPAVRKLARELHVDIQQVHGSGERGRVLAEDVRAYAAGDSRPKQVPGPSAATPRPRSVQPLAEEIRVPLRGTRRAIAEHMVRSKYTAPHVTNMDEVEVEALVAMRQQMKETAGEQGIKLTYLPFIIKAVIAALKQFPYLNSSLDDDTKEIVLKPYYHIGIAVDDPDGLVVPVIRNADQKSLLELAREIHDLTDRAHAHRLTREELGGSTFTITNFGSFGGLFATPVINYPEVAIFGTGRIQKRALVVGDDDRIVARQVMSVCLTFDHRVVDGGTAGRFTNLIMRYLHQPANLFLEMS